MIPATDHYSLILTPAGAGAIGLIRIIGKNATSLAADCLRLKNGSPLRLAAEGQVHYALLYDGDEIIDDVLASVAPDHVPSAVDITLHGGLRILERALQLFSKLGAPLIERAVSAADVFPSADFVEREAVDALQQAKTTRAVRFLARQHCHLPSYLAALFDPVRTDDAQMHAALSTLKGRADAGITLARGATVAIVGPPNSGKSTLFNRLVGRPAALVSPLAGTTRDWVTQDVEMDGVPIRLIDTAGRHETDDALEQLAIRAGTASAEQADLTLLVLDAGQLDTPIIDRLLQTAQSGGRMIVVSNKSDLPIDSPNSARSNGRLSSVAAVSVSAQTGQGTDRLATEILKRLGFSDWTDSVPCLFTQRQEAVCSDILDDSDRFPTHVRRDIRASLLGGRSIGPP